MLEKLVGSQGTVGPGGRSPGLLRSPWMELELRKGGLFCVANWVCSNSGFFNAYFIFESTSGERWGGAEDPKWALC